MNTCSPTGSLSPPPRRPQYYSGPSSVSWTPPGPRTNASAAHQSYPLGRSASTPSLLSTNARRFPLQRRGSHVSETIRHVHKSTPELLGHQDHVDHTQGRGNTPSGSSSIHGESLMVSSSFDTLTSMPRRAPFPSSRASIDDRDPRKCIVLILLCLFLCCTSAFAFIILSLHSTTS